MVSQELQQKEADDPHMHRVETNKSSAPSYSLKHH